jgi:hypothetical protein
MPEVGLLDPGIAQFPSVPCVPSETGQIWPYSKGVPHSGSAPNFHIPGWSPPIPGPVDSHATLFTPECALRRRYPSIPIGTPEGSPLGVRPGSAGVPHPHTAPGAGPPSPNGLEPGPGWSSDPVWGPDPRKGGRSSCGPSACFKASPPWIAWHHALAPQPHPIPSHPTPSHPIPHHRHRHLPNTRSALPIGFHGHPLRADGTPILRHSPRARHFSLGGG